MRIKDKAQFKGIAGAITKKVKETTERKTERMKKETYILLENYMGSCMDDSAHDRDRVSLDFYVKQPCQDITAHIKLCGVREKLPPQD